MTLTFIITAIVAAACGEFDLEQFNEGLQNGNGNGAVVPEVIGSASDSTKFAMLVHGSENIVWDAQTFTLEGLSGFQTCRLDDSMTLNANGQYAYDGGEELCGGDDDQRIKGGGFVLDFERSQIIFNPGTEEQYIATVTGIVTDSMRVEGTVNIFGIDMEIAGLYTRRQ